MGDMLVHTIGKYIQSCKHSLFMRLGNFIWEWIEKYFIQILAPYLSDHMYFY